MNTKEIIEIIQKHKIHPNKKLGQNFLCNDGILKKIIEISNINKNDIILEIGSGFGNLTEMLLEKAGSVTAVEIDSGLYAFLKKKFENIENITLVHDDFLKMNITGSFSKAVSNLPYYCSSEMLFRFALDYKIDEIFVMIQKEMSERILSTPGTKSYGALTVTLGLYYSPSGLFNIDKKSFYPQPEVSSSFLYLKRRKDFGLSPQETELFHKIVKSLFWGRRKTLKNGLSDSPYLKIDKNTIKIALKKLDIKENTRGENLTIEELKDLTRTIYHQIEG